MNLKNFKFDVDQDGIALITWDMAGRSMNVFTMDVMDELSQIVEKVAADKDIKGAVVTSGKDTFSGGADLTMLEGLANVIKDIDKAKDKKAAAVLRRVAQDELDLSAARNERQAVGRGDQRDSGRRCIRTCARLPPSRGV
jgi:3-hydroxyacyl-CoA dehydrogenase/enoyl-CoA hydratase/3-hydroxybutyryl-CoA epimerase